MKESDRGRAVNSKITVSVALSGAILGHEKIRLGGLLTLFLLREGARAVYGRTSIRSTQHRVIAVRGI